MIGAVPLRNETISTRRHVVVGVLIFRRLGHVGGDRADESVTEQNAEESSDQRGRDFVTNFLRRTTQRTHGDDDSQHGGDNAEPGSESAMVLSAAIGRAASW